MGLPDTLKVLSSIRIAIFLVHHGGIANFSLHSFVYEGVAGAVLCTGVVYRYEGVSLGEPARESLLQFPQKLIPAVPQLADRVLQRLASVLQLVHMLFALAVIGPVEVRVPARV